MDRTTHSSLVRLVTLVVALTPLVSLPLVSLPVWSADWDQEAVAKIAEQLPEATEKLYSALYAQGQPDTPSVPVFGAGDSYHEFKDRVRLLHSESMHLADELKQGKGQAETKHAYQRIKELNDDASEYAGQQFSEMPVTSEFSTIEALLAELASFYGK